MTVATNTTSITQYVWLKSVLATVIAVTTPADLKNQAKIGSPNPQTQAYVTSVTADNLAGEYYGVGNTR